MSLQRIAETVHRSVLKEISARHHELAQIALPPVDGMRLVPAAIADAWVAGQFQQLQAAKHHKAYDESAIRDHAENYASLCSRAASLDKCREFGASVRVDPPKGLGETPAEIAAGERKRWDDPMWWRRQLRRVWTRQSEDALREIGVIRKGKQPYASDAAVEHRAGRIARTREWMESRQMVSEEGDALNLVDLHAKSIANPTIRRGEFMCRIRGFEEYADSQGHIALFWTMTTPSRFHAQHAGGGVNEKWKDERARVRDAQAWLCKQWARARAKLHRKGVPFYGARVAEPHHDATPHWHALLWLDPAHADTLRETLRDEWLKDAGTEDGAQLRRITCKEIDRAQGSAVGYIAKYIAKNIDGAGAAAAMLDDETGEPVGQYDIGSPDDPESAKRRLASSIHRVAAWASVHGIRQFQQIGGPPIGLWREFRRLRDPLESALLESIRATVDGGQYRNFIESLGGMERARRRVGSLRTTYRRMMRVPKVRARRLAVEQWRTKYGPRVVWHMRDARPQEVSAAWLDRAAPKVTDTAGRTVGAITRYGEQPEPRAVGICSYTLNGDRYQVADTRTHRWRIEKKCASTDGAAHAPQHVGDVAGLCRGGSLNTATNALFERSEICGSDGQLQSDGRSATKRSGSSEPQTMGINWEFPLAPPGSGTFTLNGGGISSREGYDSFPALDSRSDLGPVAITVAKRASSISGPPDASMMVPYRDRQEDRAAGSFVGPPRPLKRGEWIRSDEEFRRLSWSLVHAPQRYQ